MKSVQVMLLLMQATNVLFFTAMVTPEQMGLFSAFVVATLSICIILLAFIGDD